MLKRVLAGMASLGIFASSRCRMAFGLQAVCASVALLCANVFAQPTNLAREDFWVPDGQVNAMVETNGVLYIGGLFDYISPVSDTGNAFDLTSGAPLPGFPKVNGAVKAILTDNAGGWFLGGLFTSVGGWPVTNLVHIRADKTVDTNWNANPDGAVLALAGSQNMLYAGGIFLNIAGEAHSLLAALNPATGAAVPSWRADVTTKDPKPTVNALTLGDGVLYIGGYFSYINGEGREHIGSVDALTGATRSWHPNGKNGVEAGSRINALAISGQVLYVGGTFEGFGGDDGPPILNVLRAYIAALDITKDFTNSVLPWNANANGPVTSIAISCDTVYVGGSFTNIGGQLRNHVAALDMNTGLATAWNPNADGDLLSVSLSGNLLYAGGKFNHVGGQSREFLAALDIHTAEATLWHPNADFGVAAITVSGGSVVAGGALGPGGKQRKNAAAFDTRTGKPLDWNPQIGGSATVNGAADFAVYALAASSNMIYLGGRFTQINGQVRNSAGAVHPITGVLSNWNPNANGIVPTVQTLLNYGGIIYAGGLFTNIGGQFRTNLAALNPITGSATTWAPNPNGPVLALAPSGANLYCAGRFAAIGGQLRKNLASVSTNTGVASSCDPTVGDQVSTLSILGNTLYAGGQFSTVSGQPRTRVAAVQIGTCTLACWDPEPAFGTRTPAVNALVAASSGPTQVVVYVGGTFGSIGGQPRHNLAALGTNCPANADPWDPHADDSVNALALAGGVLYAGGVFQNVGGQYRPSLVVFPPVGSPRITLQPLSQLGTNGQSVSFTAAATGQAPLSYQWQFNGTNIAGATAATFAIPATGVSDSGDYTIVVTNALGLVNSRPATLTVVQPLAIITQPVSQTVAPGTTVTFTVVASGNPPPTYQWQLNGVNIPGAIYSTLLISSAQRANGGRYSVVVANISGATNSAVAELVVTGPSLPFADNLASAGFIGGSSGSGSGNNQSATSEFPEPKHAGKPGGKSLWVAWTAPASGIATFHTRGSAFDTLLAIYTGTNYASLVPLASDEDRGGFGTSEASFNAISGTQYFIAVDGFAGASGNLLLSWTLDITPVQFPRIYTQPLSVSVSTGAVVTLFVQVSSPSPTNFQWFHECRLLPGATHPSLTLSNVQPEDVGNYHVVVMNASSHSAQSEDAFVEIGPDAKALSKDKLEDLLLSSGGAFASQKAGPASAPSGGFISVNAGAVGSQLFDNVGSATQQGEPIPCGVIGGSSKWMGFVAGTNAVLLLDTIGSSFDTVLAVYIGSSFANLSYVACDNNGAPDGIRSRVRFNTTAATPYLVAIDGVNGAQGNVSLNWTLSGPPVCWSLSANQTVHQGDSATLAVSVANPTADTIYFWRLNGSVISVGTSGSLTLNNLQTSQAGTYSVIVSNFAGVITTTVATVNVASIQITAAMFRTNNAKIFRVSVPSSEGFVIQRTTNFPGGTGGAGWLPVFTNSTQQPTPIYFLDYASTNLPRGFYRVVPRP